MTVPIISANVTLCAKDATDLQRKNVRSAQHIRILKSTGVFAITTGEVAHVTRGKEHVTLDVRRVLALRIINVSHVLKTPSLTQAALVSARKTGMELTARFTQAHVTEFVRMDVLAPQNRVVCLALKTHIVMRTDSVPAIATGGWTTVPCLLEIVMESAKDV